MVGGGQLARMTHQAAISLGVPLRVLARDPGESAAQVSADVRIGDERSLDDLRAFAKDCDVLTWDHEHVPQELVRALEEAGTACRPGSGALLHAQDKLVMRERLTSFGVPCPAFARVPSDAPPAFLEAFAREHGLPLVLKATRGGYDGKGVWVLDALDRDAAELVDRLLGEGVDLLVEEHVAFRRELAALVARSPYGQGAAYPIVETVQRDGICHEVISPAPGLDDAAWSSTSWRCGRTTPGTGRSRAPAPRSSSSTCGPSSTCRSARPRPPPRTWSWSTCSAATTRTSTPGTCTSWRTTRASGCTCTASRSAPDARSAT